MQRVRAVVVYVVVILYHAHKYMRENCGLEFRRETYAGPVGERAAAAHLLVDGRFAGPIHDAIPSTRNENKS